jgi:hypothetical protein
VPDRILFICKKNHIYGADTYTRRSSGLYNSTRFIVESLVSRGVDAKIVEVADNNCIDREVSSFKPSKVVIEALWVVPEKFDVLKRLHPRVKWYVHIHSQIPFLALEGIAIEWIKAYATKDVTVISNAPEVVRALRGSVSDHHVGYLPNVYIPQYRENDVCTRRRPELRVACFGAIRPMKNHLIQAMAAIRFAKEKNKELFFYVNATRIEGGAGAVLKNLRSLFETNPTAHLVEVEWLEPEKLLDLCQTMDIGMQVSMSETFNVVVADYLTAGIPVVVSKEIGWVSPWCHADPSDIDQIVGRMHDVYRSKFFVWVNRRALSGYSARAQKAWYEFATA